MNLLISAVTLFLLALDIKPTLARRVVRQEVRPPVICGIGDGIVQISIFKYNCVDYAATFIGCAGNPRTKGQELAAGETKIIDGFWYKCFEDGGRARFAEEPRCLAGEGKLMHLDTTERIGDFDWYCRPDMLAEIKACYLIDLHGHKERVLVGGVLQINRFMNLTCVGNDDQIQKQLKARELGLDVTAVTNAMGTMPGMGSATGPPRGGAVPVSNVGGSMPSDTSKGDSQTAAKPVSQPNGPSGNVVDSSSTGLGETGKSPSENEAPPSKPPVDSADTSNNGAPCTYDGKRYKSGETGISHGFRALCDDGKLKIVGCILPDGSELKGGQQAVRSGTLHKCSRKPNGDLEYVAGTCGTHGFKCKLPGTNRSRDSTGESAHPSADSPIASVELFDFIMKAKPSASIAEPEAEAAKDEQSSNGGSDSAPNPGGSCTHEGKQHNNGEAWTAGNIRFSCVDGVPKNTACVLDDGTELLPGRQFVRSDMMHKCSRKNSGGLVYISGKCGERGIKCDIPGLGGGNRTRERSKPTNETAPAEPPPTKTPAPPPSDSGSSVNFNTDKKPERGHRRPEATTPTSDSGGSSSDSSPPPAGVRPDGVCVHNGQPHKDGETWVDREVRYTCTKGTKAMIACVLANGDELQAGQWIVNRGILQRCDRTATGLEFGRGKCGAPGINCEHPESVASNNLDARNQQSPSRNGQDKVETAVPPPRGGGAAAETRPAPSHSGPGTTQSESSKPARGSQPDGSSPDGGTSSVSVRPDGTCSHNGQIHKDGETWIDREVRYLCTKGKEEMIACILQDGGELLAGQRTIRNDILQKCDKTATGIEYGSGKCGAPGFKCDSSASDTSSASTAGGTKAGSGLISSDQSDSACSDGGKQYKNGDTWTARGVRYECTKGNLELTACVLNDGSEIPPGQSLIRNGVLHKCDRSASGGLAYSSGMCNTPGFQCGVPQPLMTGRLRKRRVARDTMFMDTDTNSQFRMESNQPMGAQQPQQGASASDSASGAGGRPDGSCYDNGKQYQNGESWKDREVRYSCKNSRAEMTACVLRDGSELQPGQRVVKSGSMYKCDRTADGGLEYGAGSCGAPGFNCDNPGGGGGNSNGGNMGGMNNAGSGTSMGGSSGQQGGSPQMGSQGGSGGSYCIYEGKQYSNGATFAAGRTRYLCSGGGLQPIACILSDGTELPSGGSVAKEGTLHKCTRTENGNLMYQSSSLNNVDTSAPQTHGGGGGGSMGGNSGTGMQSGGNSGSTGGGDGASGQQSGSSATDTGGHLVNGAPCAEKDKEYKNGDTWTDGYFRYTCNGGSTRIDACVLPDHTEVAAGKHTVKFDVLYQCIKKPDGGLLYKMAICGTENIDCNDPNTFGSTANSAGNRPSGGAVMGSSGGQSPSGNGGGRGMAMADAGFGMGSSAGGTGASSKGGTEIGGTRAVETGPRTGSSGGIGDALLGGAKDCVKDGHTIMPGGVFISNNFKYVCRYDGTVAVLGCRTDSRQEIKVGETWVLGGFQHSCLARPNGAAYSLQKCGGPVQCGAEGLQKAQP